MQVIDKVKLVGSLGVLVGALVLVGCDQKGANNAMPSPPPPPEVSVLNMTAQSVTLTSELPGRTSPYQIAEVRPQVGGIVQERLFTEGADVTAGQVLYQIDPAPIRRPLPALRLIWPQQNPVRPPPKLR